MQNATELDKISAFKDILNRSKLVVVNDRISVRSIRWPEGIGEAISKLEKIKTNFEESKFSAGETHEQIVEALDELIFSVTGVLRNGVGQAVSHGGGRLHKALHKSLHKSLHKGLHKGLHKSLHKAAMDSGGGFGSDGLSWPVIEVPWREIARLYGQLKKTKWNALALDPPPAIEGRLEELADLHKKQKELREPQEAFRRDRIRIEATNDITAYMTPLGADTTSPASQTAIMFQTILWLGSLIGLQYKAAYNAARPHVLDPSLEPFIPVPAYSSYPSNHAFQSFLIAEVFARAVPEHPGGAALYRAAEEVAVNREWAGLHIRSDTEAGRELARMCAPVIEEVLKDQIRAVRAEWLGEGFSS